MSGVYIPGMEMPTSCDVCWALDDYGDYPRCRITEEQRGYNFPVREKRMDGCPFVAVPDHGDLIDRDELLKHKGNCYDEQGHLLYAVGTGNILLMPTVIDAEEGGE